MARRRTEIVDGLIRTLFEPFETERLAVAAVGGYGRRELTPASDVDLMFLFRGRNDEPARKASTAVLYPLWDAGFRVSHSVRTVSDCRREARLRLDSLTALLSARPLGGSAALVADAREAARQLVRKAESKFVADVRRSREERGTRFGSVPRTLEPDLKESLGGHRDIQALSWLRDAFIGSAGADDVSDLEVAGLLASHEVAGVRGDLDLLLLARAALHRSSGGGTNRLTSEHQEAVARLLGLEDEPDWTPADALMRDLCLAGRRTEVVVDAVLDRGRASAPAVSRNELDVPAGRAFGDVAMSLFADVAEGREALSTHVRSTLHQGAQASSQIDWSPEALSAFVRILRAGDAGVRALELMDALDLLPRFIPEWRSVRGRPQRDPYHRFPVDIHLLTTAAEASRLLSAPDEPFAMEAAGLIRDSDALLLGALLHDIGKVGRGSHVTAGAEIAERVLATMGVADDARGEIRFLVREHLLLSDTATRRNLQDEDLVLQVAAHIGDPRRLAMLYLLTVSDAASTGPAASTPWRMTLVRELVAKVNRAFERGVMDRDRAERLRTAEENVKKSLADAEPEEASRFLAAVPPSYLLAVDPSNAPVHLPLLVPPPAPGELRASLRPGRYPGSGVLAVSAADRVGLLASITGALAISGFSIHNARAFTTSDGVALDMFEIRSAFEDEITDERWLRLRSRIAEVRDLVDLEAELRSRRQHYRPPGADVPVEVHVDQTASDFYTLVEVHGPDRMGLLFELAKTFSERDIDVHAAQVSTYGPKVVDVFYVTDVAGQKVMDSTVVREITEALTKVAEAP